MPATAAPLPHVAIIGGGPAGLMAAEVLASGGARVTLFEAMPSVGRKFLMAGKGGMNITHSEDFDTLAGRYGAARERLEPQVRMARDAGLLEDVAVRHFESLYLELESIFPEEPPSLVHGDLWSGNYLVAKDGQAALIDPAAYYGHREVDIAMSTLFGGFSKGFYDSYDSEFPLAPGWRCCALPSC